VRIEAAPAAGTKDVPTHRDHVRIGLDAGEPVTDSNDLFGATVQMASRLCSTAAPDQILVSENIYAEHPDPRGFKRTKRRKLKGFSQAVTAYECLGEISSQTR
jgi:class 3 adenylate cyclase